MPQEQAKLRGVSGRVLIALTATFTCGLLGAALAVSGPQPASAALDSEEQSFVSLLNEYRAAHGVAGLSVYNNLTSASQWMADDLAAGEPFALTNRDSLGRDPLERYADFGVTGVKSYAEIIVYGYDTGFDLLNALVPGDPDLCQRRYDHIGIGRSFKGGSYGWIWVIDIVRLYSQATPGETCSLEFPLEPGATSTPTPTPSSTPAATPDPATSPSPSSSPSLSPSPSPYSTATSSPEPATPSPSPTPTPIPIALGDTDCDGFVTTVDALHNLRKAAAIQGEPDCIERGDVDCNDAIDVLDALAILRWIVDLPVAAPESCPVIGSFA